MKNILCFGDSNTYGYTPDTHTRFDENTRWTGILAKNISKYGYRVIEDGVCGRTTMFNDGLCLDRNGSEALPYALKNSFPLSYAVVMLGTNDCKTKYHADAQTVAEGIEIIVNQIKIFDCNTKILIISPILLADGVGEKGYEEEFDENSVAVSRNLKAAFQEVARRNDCMFLAASDFAEPDSADREHMNADGHKALAKAVTDVLIKDFKAK